MDSLYVVMPAYNEEKTIQSVVEQWYPVLNTLGWSLPIAEVQTKRTKYF